MSPDSRARVQQWWARLLGVDEADLWADGVHVARHALLDEADGLLVARREGGVHVSVPRWVPGSEAKALRKRAPDDLLDRRFWQDWPPLGDRKAERPAMYAYTDRQTAPGNGTVEIDPKDVAGWRDVLSPRKWRASGFDDDPVATFGIRAGKDLAAAANLTVVHGSPPMVGILTHPAFRGQGYATRVGRTATAEAVRRAGLAGYRAESEHGRSQAVGRTLGFTAYCEALTVR